jgi:hypothetical protein
VEIDDLSLPIGRVLFADTLQVMNKDLQVLQQTGTVTGRWRRSTFVGLVRAAVYMDAVMQPMAMVLVVTVHQRDAT